MDTIAKAGPGQSQELGVASESPMWFQELMGLSHHLLPGQALTEAKLEAEQLGLKPAL